MQWPLIDLKSIYNDVQQNLKELALHVETLLDESADLCPPDGAALLTKIAAVQRLVGEMLSPALLEAIEKEQHEWDVLESCNPN